MSAEYIPTSLSIAHCAIDSQISWRLATTWELTAGNEAFFGDLKPTRTRTSRWVLSCVWDLLHICKNRTLEVLVRSAINSRRNTYYLMAWSDDLVIRGGVCSSALVLLATALDIHWHAYLSKYGAMRLWQLIQQQPRFSGRMTRIHWQVGHCRPWNSKWHPSEAVDNIRIRSVLFHESNIPSRRWAYIFPFLERCCWPCSW